MNKVRGAQRHACSLFLPFTGRKVFIFHKLYHISILIILIDKYKLKFALENTY